MRWWWWPLKFTAYAKPSIFSAVFQHISATVLYLGRRTGLGKFQAPWCGKTTNSRSAVNRTRFSVPRLPRKPSASGSTCLRSGRVIHRAPSYAATKLPDAFDTSAGPAFQTRNAARHTTCTSRLCEQLIASKPASVRGERKRMKEQMIREKRRRGGLQKGGPDRRRGTITCNAGRLS